MIPFHIIPHPGPFANTALLIRRKKRRAEARQIIDKPFTIKNKRLAHANPGVRGRSPDEIWEPEGAHEAAAQWARCGGISPMRQGAFEYPVSKSDYAELRTGMYGRRLPIPFWVQDCPCIADAQILHFRVDKPCLSTRWIHRRAMPVDFLRVCNAELRGMDCFVGLSASSQ